MTPSIRALTGRLALALFLLEGCGGVTPGAPGDAREDLTAERLFPLARGNAWSYDVDNGVEVVLGFSSVVEADGDARVVRTGQAEQRYELRPDGIFRPELSAWLLRNPIAEGEEWESAGGRTARISAVGQAIEVPAGRFADCVVVSEGGGDAASIETTYCPAVGPVLVRTEMIMDLSGERVTVVGKLRGFSVE